MENETLRQNQQSLLSECGNRKEEVELLQGQKYSYKNLSINEKLCLKATGVLVRVPDVLLTFLKKRNTRRRQEKRNCVYIQKMDTVFRLAEIFLIYSALYFISVAGEAKAFYNSLNSV